MTYPIDAIRDRFPALALKDRGVPRIYLDNPAGTQVPRSVADAVARCLTTTNANLGGAFTTSKEAEHIVRAAHKAMADFLNAASPHEIIIGPNMTSLTYQMSRVLARTLSPGDEIIVTRMDHEANISPWLDIARDHGFTIRWLPFNRQTWRIEPNDLAPLLSQRTKILALNYASNLTGSTNDVHALVRLAKSAGALVYVDAVQFAPHAAIDVQALDCDFLACSSYKFFGPHLGILWGRREFLETLHPYKCRCVDDVPPDRFEPGTPQIELQAGLTATVDYFATLGTHASPQGTRRQKIKAAFTAATAHETALTQSLIAGLSNLPGVRILGQTDHTLSDQRVPTVSLTIENQKPADLAARLAHQNIFVWGGHNYAIEIFHALCLEPAQGALRIGIAHYNRPEEIDRTLEALTDAIKD